jgi:hypothetical protein
MRGEQQFSWFDSVSGLLIIAEAGSFGKGHHANTDSPFQDSAILRLSTDFAFNRARFLDLRPAAKIIYEVLGDALRRKFNL